MKWNVTYTLTAQVEAQDAQTASEIASQAIESGEFGDYSVDGSKYSVEQVPEQQAA